MNSTTTFTFETVMTGGDGRTTGAGAGWLFLRRADHLEEHAIQIEGILRDRLNVRQTQAHRIWCRNQISRSDFYASIAGMTDADLDDRTGLPDGEWSLRQILEHLIVVERYYTLDAIHALARFHAGEPHGELPDDELQVERPNASLDQLVDAYDAVREEALAALTGLSDDELNAPSRWEGIDIDVRFLLMRFAQHEREHTDQILKWRDSINKRPSEADRLLGLCWRQSGVLEGCLIGASDDVLDRDPGDGELTIRRILDHIGSAESYFKRLIVGAVDSEQQ